MLLRRLLYLVAVLIALTIVATLLAPAQPSRSPSTPPSAAPARPTAEARQVSRTIVAAPDRPAQRVRVRVGQLVDLRVRSSTLDTVTLGDLEVQPVEPGSDAHFQLFADRRASYPIVLLQAGRRIGTLVVH